MSRALLLAVALTALASSAHAQEAPRDTTRPPQTEPIDVKVLRSVYDIEAAPFELTMRGVNLSAYPIYLGAAPALWAGTLLSDADTRPALLLTASQAANFGTTFALKNLVRRPRPYAALSDIESRDRDLQGEDVFDPHSFPSGHTSSAFVIATSLSLSYPEWYVIVPSMTWATAMGLTRVWHGVHYPSDVLVGAGIGAGSAMATHLVVPLIFPRDEDASPTGASLVPITVIIPL
ncbi:MAG: phosphatase PAP2 family protein [Bacteroidota bacterium]